MGGGVGSVSCPDFLNAMAAARKKGGLTSVAGLREIAPYQYYVSGFQTGFNSEANGVYDIFESLGHDAPDRVLSETEPWCASHPDQTFAVALLALAQSLRDKLIGPYDSPRFSVIAACSGRCFTRASEEASRDFWSLAVIAAVTWPPVNWTL